MRIITCCLLLLVTLNAAGQENRRSWSTSIGYTYEPYIDGYVFVKEINSAADSLSFKEDLNVSRWHNVALKVSKTFKNYSSLSLSVERFFYSSTNKLNRNIYHNDLVLDGQAGVSTKGSYIMRGLLLFEDPITKYDAKFRISYAAGLMYDHIIFKFKGVIINDGDSSNFRENFNDQVIPSLVLGGKVEWNLCNSSRSLISLESFGTYIPYGIMNQLTGSKFEYTAINGSLGYKYDTGKFFIYPKIVGRHLHSRNDADMHVFRSNDGGINLELGIRF